MAEVKPLRALRYNLNKVDSLDKVTAPPYDIIDADQRNALAAKSPFNVVELDLPQGDDPYTRAAQTLNQWQTDRVLVRDDEPAYWLLTQTYQAPNGRQLTRHGIFARVRLADYAPGAIRPHERTHAGPKDDRLRLTRATKTNLSPVFSLYRDPGAAIWGLVSPATKRRPWDEIRDGDGTLHRLWRLEDRQSIAQVGDLFENKELLIADGHHRYETSLAYAREVGGDGDHNYVLMCLVAMEDSGTTVFPTHRLIGGLNESELASLRRAIDEVFERADVETAELTPGPADGTGVQLGFVTANGPKPQRLTLRSNEIVQTALADHAPPYRDLDTAVLETLVLRRALGQDQEGLARSGAIAYSQDSEEAIKLVRQGAYQAVFLLRPTPIEQIRAVAEAGETMPPKSTYFYPKLPSGLLFSPLD